MVITLLVIIVLMRVVQSIYNKKANNALPLGIHNYIFYIAISKFMAAGFALITLFLSGNSIVPDMWTFSIASLSGGFLVLGSFCAIKALSKSTLVLNSIFSTAGLLVPCILGIFFFDERISLIQTICIIILLFSTVLLVSSSKKIFNGFSFETLIYLIGSMISNGMVMFCQKFYGERIKNANVSLFSLLTFLIPAIALFVYLAFKVCSTKKENSDNIKLPKKVYLYAAYLAFAVFIIQQFVTILTPKLSSAVLFTIANGSATVIAGIVGAAIYKEKLTIKSTIGLILSVVSLICIKIL